MNSLAVLGGTPAFEPSLPFARPLTPALDDVVERLRPSYDAAMLTNGPLVRQLEAAAAERLGVRHAVAVSCCTSGLLLTLQALDLDGPVVLPSFTFSASGHAVVWNGLDVRFAECLPDSCQVDPDDLATRLDGASAVLATHVFGAPCDIEHLAELTDDAGAALVFDAAHAFGAQRNGTPVGGQGRAQVFSCSPTKLLVAGEGGIVATDDDDIAHHVRIGRDYGNPGDYDTQFAGLNARMSELHAALALESLAQLDDHLARRRDIADRYRKQVAGVDGVEVQWVSAADQSTYKDLTIVVDPDVFGLGRDHLATVLKADGIDTRPYFWPPLHRQTAYASVAADLPVTDRVAGRVLSLPNYPTLTDDEVDRIVEVIATAGASASEVTAALG